MKSFREIFFGGEKTSTAVAFNLLILAASVLFLYLFSYSTSPRYITFGDDSTIFQAVGKCWAEGLLPYVGTFENKGALLFAVDALGYLIYPRAGIMLLQIPFMYFSLLIAWRAFELFWSRRTTLAIWLLMIFWRASIFYEGNRTEEYSMPFLMAALYFFLRWLKAKTPALPPSVGFVYGLGFGACVLLRTTNGLPICCYALLTMVFLFRAGEFKNLWRNALTFCAGFAIICLPFVIYFAAHGALYDMLYGTILININHATSYSISHEDFVTIMIPYACMRLMITVWLIGASVVALGFNWRSKLAWSGLFAGAAMLFMLIKSRPFMGYAELTVSLFPLLFAVVWELKEMLSPTLKKVWALRGFSFRRILCKTAFIMLFIGLLVNLHTQGKWLKDVFEKNSTPRLPVYSEFQKAIPAADRDSVVLWGESLSMGQFILETDIKPRCRFFGNIQMFFGKSDPAVIDEWIQNVRSDYPAWIVYGAMRKEYSGEEMNFFEYNFRRQRNPRVEEILSERYALTVETEVNYQTIKLYRLREQEEID